MQFGLPLHPGVVNSDIGKMRDMHDYLKMRKRGRKTHKSLKLELSQRVQPLLRRAQFVHRPVHIPVQLVEHLVMLADLGVDSQSEVLLTL